MIAAHPLGLGMPEECGKMHAIYLLSDASKWMTGNQNLVLDGGYSVR